MAQKKSAFERGPAGSKTMLPVVLLTGFDAFGGADVNPSWLAVQALHGTHIEGHALVAAQLPTTFAHSIEALARLIQRHHPVLVICTGQAGGRAGISIERVAINIQDASIADNLGAQPVDLPVDACTDSPVAYLSSLPIKAMVVAMQTAGFNAAVSQTAGTFVCNHVFYGLMRLLSDPALAHVRGGFVHVPMLPEQGEPCMQLSEIVAALRVCVASALVNVRDVAHGGGQIS